MRLVRFYPLSQIIKYSTLNPHIISFPQPSPSYTSHYQPPQNTFSTYMQSSDLKSYAEKYYNDGNISCFSILLDGMTKEEKQEWLTKAQTDKKTNFVAVLSDDL